MDCSMIPGPLEEIASEYLYVLVAANDVVAHIDWMYGIYQTWTGTHFYANLYIPPEHWQLYRDKINYVNQTWSSLSAVVAENECPEMRELLRPLDDRRLAWQVTKMFLNDILDASEHHYAMDVD
ncbi:uncharacterized protein LOC121597092 [Anopheles merus]|uniref:uncharacterized protein LOC121597092 n=1 Tax=Anopheles merus TaxID=30066 RepID=UPI001BE464A4|nr:uncharacterized protein LOC121597092 [Anopheles merus]